MRIKIINPNTTLSMTNNIELTAIKYARKGTEIICVSPKTGPESIECYVDEYLAIPGVLNEIVLGDREEGVDAYIIACFGDPGLQAARELTKKPVIGIAEAAIATAKFLAPYFSVVSVLERSKKVTEDVLIANGAEKFCKSIRATGLSVLDFEKDISSGLDALAEQSEKAVKIDGAECILLGCAGFVGFVDDLRAKLGVPVLDGVSPAVKYAESLIELGLETSKYNTWNYPEGKKIIGYPLFSK